MPPLPNNTPLPNDVPAEAFRFAADLQIGQYSSNDPLAPVPVSIFARSNKPVDHWYWGRVVHDMAGMFMPKPVVPIDYCHRVDEVLGHGDQVTATEKDGLTIKGELVPFVLDDRASEIKFKAGRKVPYEGSLNWGSDGIVIEQVMENAVAKVNGYEFGGPGVIVRKWPCRGVAICPYGQDSASQTMFKAGGPTVAVTYVTGEKTTMTATAERAEQKPADQKTVGDELDAQKTDTAKAGEKTTDDKPAEKKPGEEAAAKPAGDAPQAKPAGETKPTEMTAGQKFVHAFGAQGALWFVEGKTFEQASVLFAQGQGLRLEAKDTEIADLKTKLTAARAALGEKDPLSFQAEQTPEQKKATTFAATLGDTNHAKFAAGIKLPKK